MFPRIRTGDDSLKPHRGQRRSSFRHVRKKLPRSSTGSARKQSIRSQHSAAAKQNGTEPPLSLSETLATATGIGQGVGREFAPAKRRSRRRKLITAVVKTASVVVAILRSQAWSPEPGCWSNYARKNARKCGRYDCVLRIELGAVCPRKPAGCRAALRSIKPGENRSGYLFELRVFELPGGMRLYSAFRADSIPGLPGHRSTCRRGSARQCATSDEKRTRQYRK